MQKEKKKDGVSITTCIGTELFAMLESFCEATGQSKTIAIERAIRQYCGHNDEDESSEGDQA